MATIANGITIHPDWLNVVREQAAECEARRAQARRDTGSISDAAMLYLRAVTTWLQPRIAIEIGTFIGSSAVSIQADHLYTCDWNNDCLPSTPRRTCFPRQISTQMLAALAERPGLVADFFFFDGRIQWNDLPLIARLSSAKTVYAFDDYAGHDKGVINVGLLLPRLSGYRFIAPPERVLDLESRTTIALLVPADLLGGAASIAQGA